MAAPGEFESWLNNRLDSLEVDRDVYGSYILGVLQEEDSEEEKMDAIQSILSAFLFWRYGVRLNNRLDSLEVDRDVYGSYILGVLQEEDSEEEKMDAIQSILSAFLEEDALEDVCKEIIKQWSDSSAGSKARNDHVDALFKNTNLEDVMNAKKVDREKAREDSHKKKEQDKMQREKDKLLKQERKDKEKKRTQKGERKR
ncbi:UNVERIFIED_CONTAM: hypothetical protein FKN15_024662 [Acipenser sinensis]